MSANKEDQVETLYHFSGAIHNVCFLRDLGALYSVVR